MTKVETYHINIEPSTFIVEGVEYEILNAVKYQDSIQVTLTRKET